MAAAAGQRRQKAADNLLRQRARDKKPDRPVAFEFGFAFEFERELARARRLK